MENNIKALRQEKKMSQEALSIAAQVSRPHLSDLENGKGTPGLIVAQRISKALDASIDNVFFTKMSYMVDKREAAQ